VKIETQRGWPPSLIERDGSNRFLVQVDIDGDARPEYRVRIVLIGDRLRAWIIGPRGRTASLRVNRPNARTLSFRIRGRSPANPAPGGGIRLRARSIFLHPGSKCDPSCIDRLPDAGFGTSV
jgi:hypothetical protein